ncbi:hypothetical protein PRIPAC_95954 [Pristionchus pacificus]|nr:hypothetical protein PRIPAC_95954 [Pristionchus pacificus]
MTSRVTPLPLKGNTKIRPKVLILLVAILVTVESNSFARVKIAEKNLHSTSFLFVQDVCGTDEYLKNTAQEVMVKYISLMKTTDNFFLGTNNPSQSKVIVIPSMEVLSKALSDNRASPNVKLLVSERHRMALRGKVDSHAGTNLPKLDSDFVLDMMFVGITNKHDLFANAQSFDAFPGEFTQSYDPEVALLDLVNTFGSDTKPVTPSLDNYPLCTKMLQAAFAFHTDISSAQKIFQSVTKYFDIPDVKQIYQDDDTCEFNTDQLEDKTQFTGTMYANSTTFGVETFCNSNMDVYPELIPTSDYKQAAQHKGSLRLGRVLGPKTDCTIPNGIKETAGKNANGDKKRLDTVPVSFAGSDVVGFKHIVMPFGFSYEDSPLWRSLVPDQSQWTRDASLTDYDVDAIIQDIWTITCRMAGHIESSETAEPVNPYTTKKPRVPGDGL